MLAPDTALLQDFGSSTLHHKSVVHAVMLHPCGEHAAAMADSAFLSSCTMCGLGINSSGFVIQ